PTLDQLIEQAVKDNKTIEQAIARVREARARRGISAAGLFPSIDGDASARKTDRSARGSAVDELARSDGDTIGSSSETYTAGIDASWELDIFGGTRRSLEAATANLHAAEADLRDALITLLGDVALNYVTVRTTQA